MSATDQSAIKLAIKRGVFQLLRTMLLAVIPVILTALKGYIDNGVIDWKVTLVTAAVAAGISFLTGLQEFLHKAGQYLDDESLSKGMTRF